MDTPALDTRSATLVLSQALDLAQNVYLTGQWKGVPVDSLDPGDPVYQLLRVFARLMELLIERLNRVPDKNFLAFLDLVGIEASPGAPAAVPVTFLPPAKASDGGLVPAGTQVATTQTDTADAQIFETRAAFTLTVAKLVCMVNVLPDADAFSFLPLPALPPKPDAPVGAETVVLAAPATGIADIPHVLYLGSTPLFGHKETLDVTLLLGAASGDLSTLAGNLIWSRYDQASKGWIPVAASYPAAASGQLKVVLGSFGGNDKTTLLGQENFWVAAEYTGSFPAGSSLPTLSFVRGSLAPAAGGSSAEADPEKAFAGSDAVDLSRPWRPFGTRPRYGDAVYLSSTRAFSSDVANVEVQVQLKPYSTSDLQTIFAGLATDMVLTTVVAWQYLTSDGTWKPLVTFTHTLTVTALSVPGIAHEIRRDGVVTTSDDGSFFGQPGSSIASFSFALPSDVAPGKIQGQDGIWLRALLRSDDPYGRDGSVKAASPSTFTVTPPSWIPPVIEGVHFVFTYKSTFVDVDQAVTENGLLRQDETGATGVVFPFAPFVAPAQQRVPGGSSVAAFAGDRALYLGFDRAFGDVFISAYVQLHDVFPSVDTPAESGKPLVAWEYLGAGPAWKPLDVQDETADLTSSGTVSFLAPDDAVACPLVQPDPQQSPPNLYWLRARLASGFYDHPPTVQGLYLNTVMADNQVTVRGDQVVGSGTGDPNQQVVLLRRPILAGELWVRELEAPPQTELDALLAELREATSPFVDQAPVESVTDILDVRDVATSPGATDREVWVRWRRVANFSASGPRSRHYALDPISGLLSFGDGKQQGLLPPVAKDNLVMRDARTGGGEAAARLAVPLAIKELKSSLPYVDKVFNPVAATGGSNPWSVDDILRFGPQLLKNKGRAVSAEDFEWMVLERFSEVARSKCLSTRAPGPSGLVMKPGAVTIVVVPKSTDAAPRPSSALLRQIRDFLAEECLGSIVSDVYALGPGFTEVTVNAVLHAVDPRQSSDVERRAQKALVDFFHPLTGGEDGQGWAFGRDVQLSEIFAVLQRVDGVDYVESAELVGAPGATSLAIGENNLVASGVHHIEML